jgi:Zn ribbon nucleic-acid-binding protein
MFIRVGIVVKDGGGRTVHASQVTPEAIEAANTLYWSSNRSVNRIAEELDLSKGTLYGIIEPYPAGSECPDCGAPEVYANRTAKERAITECLACGEEAETQAASEPEAEETTEGVVPGATKALGRRVSTALQLRDDERARTIVGGALLGAAVGLALVMWSRRR